LFFAFPGLIIEAMQPVREEIYTVTAANRMARYTIEESFPSIWVEGEISNYHHHGSGHRYFTLKDDQSQLRCAMWRSSGAGLKFEPKDGLKVMAHGNLTVYERGGQFQMIIKRLMPSGMGELELAFRQLKEKLEKEGLFDPAHKKSLPSYPMRIGIVTSPTGAAIHDIIRVVKRRNPIIDLVIWPSEVQGDTAPPQLVAGIENLNEYGEMDLIIIGRGGGSLEDLWAFNDEQVVRAIYNSKLPVISAVGHEVDVSLSDLAADYAASTPSVAAEIAAWPLEDLRRLLGDFLEDMDNSLRDRIREGRDRLRQLSSSPALTRPRSILEERYQYLDGQVRLLNLLSERRFDSFREAAALVISRLEALSPLSVLTRGYSVARSLPGKKVVKTIGNVNRGDRLETIVGDGSIISVVDKTEEKN